MINILHIFEDSRFGGPHNQCINLLSNISNKKKYNHEILLCDYQSNYFAIKCKEVKIKYHKIKINFLSKNFFLLLRYLFCFFSDIKKILSFLRKNKKFSIIALSNGTTSFKSLIAAILAKKKILWHIHDSESHLFIRLLVYFFSPYVNYFIFSSNSSKKYYFRFIRNNNYKILQTAIDFKKLKFKKINSKKFVIGLIANFNKNKNILFFLKLILEINKLNDKFFFMISGRVWKNQVSYYKECKDFIKKNKIKNIFIKKDNKNLNNFYNKINLQLLVSDTESSPTVLWEGMFMRKIILTTNVGDVKKFIKNGKNGFILDKNVKSFKNKIFSIFNKKINLIKVRENSRKTAFKNFNIKNFEIKYTNIINKIN